jgi:hypothetical protein
MKHQTPKEVLIDGKYMHTVEATDGCHKCCLEQSKDLVTPTGCRYSHLCLSTMREDRKSVIFKHFTHRQQ